MDTTTKSREKKKLGKFKKKVAVSLSEGQKYLKIFRIVIQALLARTAEVSETEIYFPLNEEVVETHIVYGLEEEEAPFKVRWYLGAVW